MTLLQAHGIAAAIVQDPKDVVEDPQVNYRKHLVAIEGHQELGTHYSQAPAFILSNTPAQLRPSSCLGQDNEYVITRILGMSDDQFIELLNTGVLD